MRRSSVWLFLCLLSFSGSAAAQTPVAGKALSVRGPVEWEHPAWSDVVPNQVLDVGTHVRTGDAGRAVILLVDETQLKINADTDLRLTSVKAPTTLFQRVAQTAGRSQESVMAVSKGQVWLRATTNKPTDVKITTPAVTAAIRGTEFDLRVGPDGESIITVLDGSVDMSNAQGAVLVMSGEQGRALPGQAPTKTLLVNPLDAVQWTITYVGAVSPRDYPVRFATVAAARAAAAQPGLAGVALAEARHDAGDRDGALQAVANINTPDASAIRGWILLEQHQSAEALVELDRVLPPTPRSALGRALALSQLGRYEAASQALQGSTDPGAIVQRAQMNLLGGDPLAAQATLEALPPSSDAYGAAQALLLTVHLVQNRKDEARQAAERAVASHPDQPSAYLALSLVEQSFFDLPAAIGAAERARALAPGFAQADVQLATLLFGTGETGRAYDLMQQVVARAPGEATAESTLGFILLSRARETDARAALDESIRLDSTQGEPHLGLGILEMRQGHLEDAVSQFLEAAILDPRRSLYQSYLASALYDLRRFNEAFGALTTAERLDPRDPTPHLYAGLFLKDLNRPVEAIHEIDESIRLNNGRAVYRSRFLLDGDTAAGNVHLANAYDSLGLAAWANEAAINSATADPTNSASHLLLGDTFLRLDDRAQAGASELLVARMLQPVNLNAFNSFNSYTTLYSKPQVNWYAEGTGASFTTEDVFLKSYGGNARAAYVGSVSYDASNGFQLSNGDSRAVFGSVASKLSLNRDTDFLLGVGRERVRGGLLDDTALVSDVNHSIDREDLTTSFFEAGVHRRLRPGSELLVHFNVASEHSLETTSYGSVTDVSKEWSAQVSHILAIGRVQIRYGAEYFRGHQAGSHQLHLDAPGHDSPAYIDHPFDPEPPVSFAQAYTHVTWPIFSKLTVTGGLNYDDSPHDNEFYDTHHRLQKRSPQGGLLFRPTQSTTVRAIYIEGVQTHEKERLAPTHVFGFPVQANNLRYTATSETGLSVDQRLGTRTFTRVTWYRRPEHIPYAYEKDNHSEFVGTYEGVDRGLSAAFERILSRRLTVTALYEFRHEDHLLVFDDERQGSVLVSYVAPTGLQIFLRENYLRQRGTFTEFDETYSGPFSTNVPTTDLSARWDLPRKRGFVGFSVTDVTENRYQFLRNPLSEEHRVPVREALLTFGVYF